MPLGSFNKKLQQTFDQRSAASDNAQLATFGGRIFNVGGQGNPTAEAQTVAETPKLLIVGVVVVIVFVVWAIFLRK